MGKALGSLETDGRTDGDGSMQSFGNARGFNETTATLAHNLLSHVPSA